MLPNGYKVPLMVLPKNESSLGHCDERDDIVNITFFYFFTAKHADH